MSNQQLAATIDVQRRGEHVAVVTITRPEARNAINAQVAKAMEEAVTAIEADEAIRAVVLTGSGERAFCSGADLRAVAAGQLDDLFTASGGFAGFVNARRRKPWIAAVNGFALAGGCEIALACDMVLAVPDARFGLPEVTRGLIASAGGLYRLPRALPRAVAFELIATGQPIDAARAYALGLVNRICEPDALLDDAVTLANQIASNAPLAVTESLRLARLAAMTDDDTLRQAGDEAQARLATTADFTEGALAFVEKRVPRWQGR